MSLLTRNTLERKCRWLFGISLFLLIVLVFAWVDLVAYGLVGEANDRLLESTRIKAQSLASRHLARLHNHCLSELAAGDERELLGRAFRMMNPESEPETGACRVLRKDDETTREVRDSLLRDLESQLGNSHLTGGTTEPAVMQPLYAEQRGEGTYRYYEAHLRSRCAPCHAADTLDDDLRILLVTLPYDGQSETTPTQIRGVLCAAGIVAWFISMFVLSVIIRYVVVNPLAHLRQVSDEIRQGDLEARAEIGTEDEFQDLAESFNRMLRHLTETQGNLQQVNRNLDAKVDELAQLNMRLYEMNRLKSDFLANMSHELRTPLNSIIGFSEVLQGLPSLDEKQQRYAGNIRKSGRVLLEMINDILDLAKLESGKTSIRPTEFRLGAIVHAQCDIVRSLSQDKNIDLQVRTPPQDAKVFQDQAKLQQILTNLLSNAIKFTPEGGVIIVAAEFGDDDANFEVSVSDTGVGIAEEDREIIFEKFRQSNAVLGQDGLTREFAGTGLGLSIVKELCKLLGGEIEFDSELGKGSVFRVTLPVTCETSGPEPDPLPPLEAGERTDITPARW